MNNKRKALLPFFLVWCLFMIGWAFPLWSWGYHQLHFLEKINHILPVGLSIVSICLILSPLFISDDVWAKLANKVFKSDIEQVVWLLTIVILMALGILLWPIVFDYFGDSYRFEVLLDQTNTKLDDEVHKDFFSFGLHPWNGEQFIMSILTYISYYFNLTFRESFKIYNLISGVLWVIIWIWFSVKVSSNYAVRLISIIIGVTAPFVQFFFQHIEIYPIIYVSFLFWLLIFVAFPDKYKNKKLLLLAVFWIILFKMHSIFILLIPVLTIWLCNVYAGQLKLFGIQINTWKGVWIFVILPIYVIGSFLYFFYFQDYNDNRNLTQLTMAFDHLFLPIIPPEPPRNNYHLFSIGHFNDLFNLLFVYSMTAIAVVISLLFFFKVNIDWNNIRLLTTGAAVILFLSFFFMVNPILSLPIDSDLFSLVAPLVLVFLVLIITEAAKTVRVAFLIAPIIGVGLLGLSIVAVHHSREAISYRYESLGRYIYKTNYEWAAIIIQKGLRLDKNNFANYKKRKEAILTELTGIKEVNGLEYDQELAALYLQEGELYLYDRKEPDKALGYLEKAMDLYPMGSRIHIVVQQCYFQLGNYNAALYYALGLYQSKQIEHRKAVLLVLQSQLYANNKVGFNTFLEELERFSPYDPVPKDIRSSLKDTTSMKKILRDALQ